MRINTNIAAMSVLKNLRKGQEEGRKELQRLSSGERIITAADDAAGLAIGVHFQAYSRSLAQAQNNASAGISFIQMAEGGLSEISNMLTRLRELTIQSASDTIGYQERGLLNLEYQQLLQEIDRLAEGSRANEKIVINQGQELEFHIGGGNQSSDTVKFKAANATASTKSIGISSTSIEKQNSALKSIRKIDHAINQIGEQRADLGAMQSRMQSALAALDVSKFAHDMAKSKILDADLAEVSAKYASSMVIQSAGIGALAQANNLPYQIIRLIT